MNQPPNTSEIGDAIVFFITVLGLLGSFFAIHLSDWVRDILQLKSKYEFNEEGDAPATVAARAECRYELRRVYNHVPLLITIVLAIFLLTVGCVSHRLIATAPTSAILKLYGNVLLLFQITYGVLAGYFLVFGYWTTWQLHRKLNP